MKLGSETLNGAIMDAAVLVFKDWLAKHVISVDTFLVRL
jgi:hypothetical protein